MQRTIKKVYGTIYESNEHWLIIRYEKSLRVKMDDGFRIVFYGFLPADKWHMFTSRESVICDVLDTAGEDEEPLIGINKMT